MKQVLLIILASTVISACVPNYSEGERVGVVTKFSKKGIIFKSWEGSLNQGGMKTEYDSDGNSSLVANVIDFNAADSIVIADINKAAETGQRVKLTYRQWLIKPITINNSRVITKVDFLDSPSPR